MAGYLQNDNGRGRRGRYRPLAEINVTPLVDVMLVLLIIFMVTAPLMTSGVPVDLPKTSAQPINSDSEPLTVSIDAQGQIFLQDQQVQLPELVSKLQAIAQNNADRRIFVRGDKDLAYGRIMEVMGTITQGGFTKVALLAEQPAATPAGSTAPPALAAPSVPTPGAAAAPAPALSAPTPSSPAARAPSAPTRKGG
jgi:biopolymer transport protein TolR